MHSCICSQVDILGLIAKFCAEIARNWKKIFVLHVFMYLLMHKFNNLYSDGSQSQ